MRIAICCAVSVGSESSMFATYRLRVIRGFTSARFSITSTTLTSPPSNWGSLAHFTSVASTKRSSGERCDMSPAGASVSAKSMINAIDFPSVMRIRR